MKHFWAALCSALLSLAVTLIFQSYGAHDIQGLLAYFVGFVGVLVHEWLMPGSHFNVAVTIVNFLLYFSLIEIALAVKHRFSIEASIAAKKSRGLGWVPISRETGKVPRAQSTFAVGPFSRTDYWGGPSVSDPSLAKSNIRQCVHTTQMQCTRSRSEIALGRWVCLEEQSGVEPFSRTQTAAALILNPRITRSRISEVGP